MGVWGRPWLFAELVELLGGGTPIAPPSWLEVAKVMREHAASMVAWEGQEHATMRAFRKHAAWYTKGFRASTLLRERLMHVDSLAQLDDVLATVPGDEPFPPHALRAVRGKRGRQARVVLPHGYLDSLDDDSPPSPEAESLSSGG